MANGDGIKSLLPHIHHSPLDWLTFPWKDVPWLHPYSISVQPEEARVVVVLIPDGS
jgi:hypothetical protein